MTISVQENSLLTTMSASEKKSSVKKKPDIGPPTKVVIRRLPPSMGEDEFCETVSPLPEHNFLRFVRADNSWGVNSFSRVYINFKNVDDVFCFRDRFDGYVFIDQKGAEYPAIVEYAPFQKIPKSPGTKKPDVRTGTIEQDPDYLSFVDLLANPVPSNLPALEAVLEEIEAHEREMKANLKLKTPLLEFIEQRKAERIRIREEWKEEKRWKEMERRKKEEEKLKRKNAKEKSDDKKTGLKMEQKVSNVKLSKSSHDTELPKRKRDEKQKQNDTFKDKLARGEQRVKGSHETTSRDSKGKKSLEVQKKNEKKPEKKISGQINESCRKGKPKEVEERRELVKEIGQQHEVMQEVERSNEVENNKGLQETQKEIGSEISRGAEVMHNFSDQLSVMKLSDAEEGKEAVVDNCEGKISETEVRKKAKEEPVKKERSSPRKREKDPRTERRIRNKDRPAMAIYRPGQSRLKTRAGGHDDGDDGDPHSHSTSPVSASEGKGCQETHEKETKTEDVNEGEALT